MYMGRWKRALEVLLQDTRGVVVPTTQSRGQATLMTAWFNRR